MVKMLSIGMHTKNDQILRYLQDFNREPLTDDQKRFTIKAGWTSLSPEKIRSTRRAMRKYRKTHTRCEITGTTKKIQIHHIIPVWEDPSIADDPNNFIALSASANIHHIFGHDRSFSRKYVKNIRELSTKFLKLQEEMDVVHRDEVKVNKFDIKGHFKSTLVSVVSKFLDL